MKTIAVLALALSLSACGGGWKFGEDEGEDPVPSGVSAKLTVSSSSDATLVGDYVSSNVDLSDVQRSSESNVADQTCSFRFEGLRLSASRGMEGRITYARTTETRTAHETRSVGLNISSTEYGMTGATGVSPQLSSNRIVFAGAVLTATVNGNVRTVTVTGDMPVRGGRPTGC